MMTYGEAPFEAGRLTLKDLKEEVSKGSGQGPDLSQKPAPRLDFGPPKEMLNWRQINGMQLLRVIISGRLRKTCVLL
jgi:hypothetical protein